MFTEESSQQITPLPEEHADPPQPRPAEAVQPLPKPEWWVNWIDAGIAVVVWVVSVIMLALIPVIFTIPYFIYKVATSGPPSPDAIMTDKILLFISVAGILPTHLLTFVVVWAAVTYLGRRPFWKTIAFKWPARFSPIVTTLLSAMVATVLFGFAILATYLYGEHKTDLDLLIESSVYTRFAIAFVAVATAPLIEELIYRGLIYQALEKAAGMWVAIPIVSLLFAGVHVIQYKNNIVVILVITLLSITLTVVRALSGTVLPAFIIHLVFNGIQSILIVLGAFNIRELFK